MKSRTENPQINKQTNNKEVVKQKWDPGVKTKQEWDDNSEKSTTQSPSAATSSNIKIYDLTTQINSIV